MGRLFGFDFGAVRTHTSGPAAQSATAVHADAYTTGRDIVFAPGQFADGGGTDRRLLAHELAHVVQQARGGQASSPTLEAEADKAAGDVARGTPANVQLGAPPGIQRQVTTPPPPPQSLAGQASGVAGVQTTAHRLAADVTIAANQTLPSPPGKTIHTGDATDVHVEATGAGISIGFSPYLIITAHSPHWYVPDVDIWVHSAEWSFAQQKLTVNWTARNIVNWLGDPGTDMLTAMQGAIHGLPARMFVAGYNPFNDPTLPGDLLAFASRLGSSAGAGITLPKTSGASVEASLTLDQELARPAGKGVTLVFKAGARATIRANFAGVPQTPADTRITSVTVSFSPNARLDLRAIGQDWPVLSLSQATFAAGHVSANYTIIHEDLGTLLLNLLAAAQVEADPLSAGRIRSDLTFRDQAAHQRVDAIMHEQLEPLLRDLIMRNRAAIRGLDLVQILGLGGAATPVPTP
jgi:hypothetical protein